MNVSSRGVLAVCAALVALAAPARGAAADNALLTTSYVKIGDAKPSQIETYPTSSPGGRAIAVSGSTVYAVYTAEPNGDSSLGEVRLATSLDGGLTWEAGEVIARDPMLRPYGASIAVSQDPQYGDVVHVVWGLGTYSSGEIIQYARSVRNGWQSTWTTPVAVSYSLTRGQTRSIGVDARGNVHVLYGGFGAFVQGYEALYYSHSSDGGTTWDEFHVQITPYGMGYSVSNVAVDPEGTAYFAYRTDANGGTTFVSRRALGATTWTSAAIESPAPVDPPSLAVCDASRIYVAGVAPPAGGVGGTMELLGTADGGATWTKTVLGTTDVFGGRPLVVASPTCALSAVWSTNGGIQVTHAGTGSTWTKPVTITPWAGNYTHPAVASNAAGKVNVMYRRTGPSGTTVMGVVER